MTGTNYARDVWSHCERGGGGAGEAVKIQFRGVLVETLSQKWGNQFSIAGQRKLLKNLQEKYIYFEKTI